MNVNSLLNDADQAAASLARAYQRLGEFVLVVRTHRNGHDGSIRVIGPNVGNEVMSTFLQKCAETLFDGPSTVTKAGE